MKSTARKAGAILTSALAVSMMASCGGGGTGGGAVVTPGEVVEGGGAVVTPGEVVEGEGGAAAAEAECGAPPSMLTISFWSPINQETLDSFTAEYGIPVQVNNSPDAGTAYEAIINGLATNGAGLSDVHYMEGDAIPELMVIPDDWATLPEIPGRWVDWKNAEATFDGQLKGYGTDIGPIAIAFNADALEAAGLPSDVEGFSEFVGGENMTWETFLDAGRQYHEATGRAWLNDISDAFNAAIRQLPVSFEDPVSGLPIEMANNQPIHDLFIEFGTAVQDGLSAGISIWSPDAAPGFQNQTFATVIAPAWMTGHIQNSAGNATGWRIAPVFPGGGGNWGGSFVAVPSMGPNVCWATKLAAWLTTPEAAVRQFLQEGHFPSQVEALNDPRITETENEFFGQHIGQIYAELAQKTPADSVTGFRGERFGGLADLAGAGIGRVFDQIETPAQSWETFVGQFDALGFPTAP